MKKELNAVVLLQMHIETVSQAIKTTRTTMSQGKVAGDAQGYLGLMDTMQAQLLQNVERLFSTLCIGEGFPDLSNFPFEFVQTLILARDLKKNIQMRAAAAFFEWDRLDQAVGGRDQALGKCVTGAWI